VVVAFGENKIMITSFKWFFFIVFLVYKDSHVKKR